MDRKRKRNIYALYKGEEMLSVGTIQEISEELNIKEKTVYFYQTPAYIKRTSEIKGKRLIKL